MRSITMKVLSGFVFVACSIAGLPARAMDPAEVQATADPEHNTNGIILRGGRIILGLSTNNYLPGMHDRVDNVQWKDSAGVWSENYATQDAVIFECGAPVEFFGQAWTWDPATDDKSGPPRFVVAGVTSRWIKLSNKAGRSVTRRVTCQEEMDAVTDTLYTLYPSQDARKNEIRVTRTFRFSESTPVFPAVGFLPYVPRVSREVYSTVLYPNISSTILKSKSVFGCEAGCAESNWNQRWFALDDGAGRGLMIIRSPKSRAPASLLIDNDDFSDSNNTSVLLIQPVGGWHKWLTEEQYLCFYDSKTWPSTYRALFKLPKGCAIPPG